MQETNSYILGEPSSLSFRTDTSVVPDGTPDDEELPGVLLGDGKKKLPPVEELLTCGNRTSLALAFSCPCSACSVAMAVTSSTPAGIPGTKPSATPRKLENDENEANKNEADESERLML